MNETRLVSVFCRATVRDGQLYLAIESTGDYPAQTGAQLTLADMTAIYAMAREQVNDRARGLGFCFNIRLPAYAAEA